MARTPEYWYDVIIAEKQTMASLNNLQPNVDTAQDLLADVTTSSKVARWRLWIWCVAVAIYAIDVLFDLLKLDLESIALESRYGTLPWYVKKSLDYQHGDALVLQNLEWKYATENLTARVVKRASAQKGVNLVLLKVAKLSGTVPVPLSSAELIGYTSYIDQITHPGINVTIISAVSDELRLYLNVNYDPLVLTATGELLSTPGTFPVEDAIDNYLSDLNNEFNGEFENMIAIDKVQDAVGVVSAYHTNSTSRYGTNPFVAFSQKYLPNAGHMIIDPLTPLSTTITYTPNV